MRDDLFHILAVGISAHTRHQCALIMSHRKDTTKMPLKSAMKAGSKGSVSLKTSAAAIKSTPKVDLAQPSKGKGKAVDEEEDYDDAFEGESNASGFSGGEDDLDEKDEFDLDEMDVDGEGEGQGDEEEEADTEDEIDAMYDSKKKSKMNTSECLLLTRLVSMQLNPAPPEKRKAPTNEDTFGNTLAGLLDDDVTLSQPSKIAHTSEPEEPSAKRQKPAKTLKAGENPILALSSRPQPRSSAAETLERKAKRALKAEEKERQDRARVKNVIEGWGPTADGAPGGLEWERGLRKVAQRGGQYQRSFGRDGAI